MPRNYAYSLALAALMALTVGFAFQADAAFIFFNSKDEWQAELGNRPGDHFNFNSFTANTSFAFNAINFGAFSLSTHATQPSNLNQIVGDSLGGSPNGSPFASMFLDSSSSVVLGFNQPTMGFGAEFFGAAAAINFGVFLHGAKDPIIVAGPSTASQYFGILSTDPIDRIEFLYSGPPGGNVTEEFDNVDIASATPAPATLMMLGIGATMFAAYSCWRLRRGTIDIGPDPT